MNRGRLAVGATGLLAAMLAIGPSTGAQSPGASGGAGAGRDPTSVMAWNDIAVNSAVTVAKTVPAGGGARTGASCSRRLPRGRGHRGRLSAVRHRRCRRQPDASVDAAVAAAAHDVLVKYFPEQAADLDTAYTAALAAVPDGAAKTAGCPSVRRRRRPSSPRAPVTGWAPTWDSRCRQPHPVCGSCPPDQKPLAPWYGQLKPFMLTSPDQFLPPPPPDLKSAEWATEFNEIKDLGGADSTKRTPEQTLIAQFFSANAGAQENAGPAQGHRRPRDVSGRGRAAVRDDEHGRHRCPRSRA